MVLSSFRQKKSLHFFEFGRVLCGQIIGQTEVRPGVKQLPNVGFERPSWFEFPRSPMNGAGEPTIVVDGPVAKDLEILRGVAVRGLRVSEGVEHAHSFDWPLHCSVHALRLRQARCLQYGWSDVDYVMPLRAHLVLSGDALGPVDNHSVAGTAIIRRNLLGPCERSVAGNRPAGSEVRVGRCVTELVVMFQDVCNGLALAVEIGHLVVEPAHAAFRAGTVVADDVENECVVELTRIANRIY